MKRNTVNKIKYLVLLSIGLIALSNIYLAKKANENVITEPTTSPNTNPKQAQPIVINTPKSKPSKKIIQPKTLSEKASPKNVPVDSNEHGVIKRKAPVGGDEAAWTKYYEDQYSPEKIQRIELRELYLKVNKTSEEITAMLDEFDSKITKLKAQLDTNPDDGEVKKLLNRAYKTKAYIKVLGKRFEEL